MPRETGGWDGSQATWDSGPGTAGTIIPGTVIAVDPATGYYDVANAAVPGALVVPFGNCSDGLVVKADGDEIPLQISGTTNVQCEATMKINTKVVPSSSQPGRVRAYNDATDNAAAICGTMREPVTNLTQYFRMQIE